MALTQPKAVYDAAVIGGGPAGLSAALALSRVLRSAVIFDSGLYRNAASDRIHNLWGGLDGSLNSEVREKTRQQIQSYGVAKFVFQGCQKAGFSF